MPGEYDGKFANDIAFLGYMMANPGKKFRFLGYEYGQFREWAYKEGLEFFLSSYEKHAKLLSYVKVINHLYKDTPPLYEIEDSWDGFEWISADESSNNVLSFIRRDKSGKEIVVCVNFSGLDFKNYCLGVPEGEYKIILNSDSTKFGGSGLIKKTKYKTNKKRKAHGKQTSIKFDLPKFSCIYFEKL
jgi:1,4-alpha-glucan branching enzyme